ITRDSRKHEITYSYGRHRNKPFGYAAAAGGKAAQCQYPSASFCDFFYRRCHRGQAC
ncbi:hypothetical protein HHI36_007421, partial [Cryptolaemus montrouzieri]